MTARAIQLLARMLLGCVAGQLLLRPDAARAHLPYPSPVAVMPADEAAVVGLNVGLLVQQPGEATWQLTCAADPTGDVLGYRADPAQPTHVLALLHAAVALTEDLGCTWMQFPLGDSQVLDAGFDPDGRIWVLSAKSDRPEALLQHWNRARPDERRTVLLPAGYEIGNAMPAGAGATRRFFVTGYDRAAGSAYLFEVDPNGAGLRTHAVTEASFELPRLVYAASDSHALVVRLMGGEGERLALTRDGESFSYSPQLPGFIRGFFHNGADGLLVALSGPEGDLLLRLDREGVPLETLSTPFAARQLGGSAQRLFALSYALGGSALLFDSADLGASWSPVVRLADVRGPRCAAPAAGCEAGCLQLVAEGLVTSAACAVGDGDDAGVDPAPAGPEPPAADDRAIAPRVRTGEPRGCATVAGTHRAGCWWLFVAALVLVALRRLSRHKAAVRSRFERYVPPHLIG